MCDVEELKDTVTTRLGCDPNFKYFYDSDEDIYNAAPHQYNCTVRFWFLFMLAPRGGFACLYTGSELSGAGSGRSSSKVMQPCRPLEQDVTVSAH